MVKHFLPSLARTSVAVAALLSFLVGRTATAQNSFTKASLTPASPATLLTGERIQYTYQYAQNEGTVKILVTPTYKGSGMSYTNSATATHTTATGNGTGFVSLKSPGKIDQLHFKMYNSTMTTLLAERVVNVSYTYADYAFTNVQFDIASPNTVATRSRINFTYDYVQKDDSVRVLVQPRYTGSRNWTGSPNRLLTTTTGSNSGFFSLPDSGHVSMFTLKMYSTSNLLLHEISIPVDYSFVDYHIHGVTFTPSSSDTLATGQRVNFTFDFLQTTDTAYVVVIPRYKGSYGYSSSGRRVLTTPTGSSTGFFTLRDSALVTGVLFRMYDNTTRTLVYETEVPVHLLFVPYSIHNIRFTPHSPDTLLQGQRVFFTFDFAQSTDTAYVQVFPTYEGESGIASTSRRYLYTESGSSTGFFTLRDSVRVTALKFKLFDASTHQLVYETKVSVDFLFLPYSIHNIRFTPPLPDTLAVRQQVHVTYDYLQSQDSAYLVVVPTYTGANSRLGSARRLLTTSTGSNQGFFSLPDSGHVNEVFFRIYDVKGSRLLYETSVKVDYLFWDYEVFQVRFSPASPDSLTLDERVNFSYRYFQTSGTLKLSAAPSYQNRGLGYTSGATPTLSTQEGSGTGFFALLEPGKVDKITFTLFADTGIVYRKSYPVAFTFYEPLVTSTQEKDDATNLLLFPNPAHDQVTLQLPASSSSRIEVRDPLGKTWLVLEKASSTVVVSTASWPAGLYTVQITEGAQASVRKLWVE